MLHHICPFDLDANYRFYVDGKPRFHGVRDFLSSQRNQLPEGDPDDPAEVEPVCRLGNRKDDLINQIIADVGVEPCRGTVQFIHQLRRDGFKIAVVTSSHKEDVELTREDPITVRPVNRGPRSKYHGNTRGTC